MTTLADFTRIEFPHNTATSGNALARFIAQSLGQSDGEGPRVTASTVRGLPGAWNSICKIAGHIGIMPLNLMYRASGRDAEIASWLAGHRRMAISPSALVNPAVFRETIQHHVLLHGNGRAYIARNNRAEPQELVILDPLQWSIVVVAPGTDPKTGVTPPSRKYHVNVHDPKWALSDVDVLHIMGLSDDGIGGMGVIEAAKQALGLAVAQQTRALAQEKNGARVRFLIKAPPGALTDESKAKEFIDKFNDYHAGPDNADKVGLLRAGMDITQISQTNQESQAIEARRFSRQDVALLFQVEQMLGDGEASYASDNESKNQAYLTNCLMRWTTRWEEECKAKLLTQDQFDSGEYYFKFDASALLKGTTAQRYTVYQIARQMGIMSPNEIREREDMPRRTDPEGDRFDNPATTPGGQAKPATTQDPQPSPQPKQSANDRRIRDIVAKNIGRVVDVERSRVEKAAAGESNFCNWLTTFYATWTDRVASVIVDCGGDSSLAQTWVSDSQNRLLGVADRVTDVSTFADAVRSETATWSARVDSIAETIVNTGAANYGA